jgi:hypothetical protein
MLKSDVLMFSEIKRAEKRQNNLRKIKPEPNLNGVLGMQIYTIKNEFFSKLLSSNLGLSYPSHQTHPSYI